MQDFQIRDRLKKAVLGIQSSNFDCLALDVFRYQAKSNPVYENFISLLSINSETIGSIDKIPYLPIQLFKTYPIVSGTASLDFKFESSGTTGQLTSKHYVSDFVFYHQVSQLGFENSYGPLSDYCFLALLPSYLERQNSSLVNMVEYFINQSNYPESGFYLNNLSDLLKMLMYCKAKKIPTVLIGVSFALLDLAEQYKIDLSGIIIMETGGMKGKRKELTRIELHNVLKASFHSDAIHSEYGMTELLSQSYSKGKGLFYPSSTKKVLWRDILDPLNCKQFGKRGGLNIIDLANIDSCSFIATDDLTTINEDGSFSVLGRLDNSDIRGCNLMIDELNV